ncbi:MAG: SDR family NAD(P)-dependent oxidoreductase [Thermoanaerobaculales bacterium]|nr:SDR family NAD(P)-dependent oxidoreductase [Thermoanaerobaculales bacterium]
MKKKFTHAIVVGASSGIGEALVRRLAAEGCRVAAVARRGEKLDRLVEELGVGNSEAKVFSFPHDVENTEEIGGLFQDITGSLGGLDLVIYAAGVMHRVDFSEYDTAKDLDMLRVNLEGAVAWLNPVAERFAALKSGTIVGIGSVAGDRGRSGGPVYNTSKAGFHTYLEALRNRVARFGVKVVTIKPGFVDTQMIRGLHGLFWVVSADRAAEIILRKARCGAVVAYVPARWRLVMWIIRNIPSVVFRRLKV